MLTSLASIAPSGLDLRFGATRLHSAAAKSVMRPMSLVLLPIMDKMKILILAIITTFCGATLAESSSVVSTGISFDDFEKQGGKYERKTEFFGDSYRINLDNFENCSPTEVIVNAVANEKTILRVVLDNRDGWYEFGAHSGVHGKNMVYFQIHCVRGIPLRNVWF
jgi:hypothetical protein